MAHTAARQHLAVSLAQVIAAGVPKATFLRHAGQRGWQRLHRGVYALPGSTDSPWRAMAAALLAGGDRCVLGGESAAFAHGLLRPPARVRLLLPEDRRAPALRGVAVTRTATLVAADCVRVRGLRITAPARTVCDLAAVCSASVLRGLLIDGRQRRVLDLGAVAERLRRAGPVPGAGRLRRLLWELDPVRCDSVLELRVRRPLRAARLPAPHPEPLPVRAHGRTLAVDIAWPRLRVGVEVDGFGSHAERADLTTDHRRSNRLTLSGWRILRVDWDRYERDPDGFVDEVHELLRQADS